MKRLFMPAAFVAALVAIATLSARADDGPKMPKDVQHGLLANSMLVTKEPNNTGLLTGVHHIYVNSVGAGRFKRGGSTTYPDGTVFVDDVREFTLDDGVYHEAGRKFVTVMVKDSKKYAETGGWGFGRFVDGKAVDEAQHKTCFTCHSSNASVKEHDFVSLSTLNPIGSSTRNATRFLRRHCV